MAEVGSLGGLDENVAKRCLPGWGGAGRGGGQQLISSTQVRQHIALLVPGAGSLGVLPGAWQRALQASPSQCGRPGPMGCPNSAQGGWPWGKGLGIHSRPQGPKAERDREPQTEAVTQTHVHVLGQCYLRKKVSERLSGQERTWRRLSSSWLPRAFPV